MEIAAIARVSGRAAPARPEERVLCPCPVAESGRGVPAVPDGRLESCEGAELSQGEGNT